MRVLLWVVLTVAGLWASYWFVGARAVERAAHQAVTMARSNGQEVRHDGLRVAGFPNRFDLTLTAPAILDPVSGFGWRGQDLQILAMTWKPWHLIALAPSDQVITTPVGEVTVTASRPRGSLLLHPGPDLALSEIVVEAADVMLSGPGGRVEIATVNFATAEDSSRRNSHRIGLRLADLTPDPAVSAALPDLPTPMSGLHLDAYLLLSAPLDRHLGATRPQVTGIILDLARLDWGPLQVTAKGTLAAVSDGTAEGRIDLRIENWRLLPDVLGQSGLIDPVLAPTLLRALEIMAETAPDPKVLDTALTFKSGRASLGALPIGPAPMLAYRQ
jgi:Uncharacterized protein conserved in bacteria (DUF2125)